jgi:hypothetical protein
VIIDLTTLEKCGKFQEFEHLISVYNGKRGLHLVVLYLVVGRWRVPWSLRVWRGKQAPSPTQLGLKLVKNLPKALTEHFQVMILADTAFGSVEFLHAIRHLNIMPLSEYAVTAFFSMGAVSPTYTNVDNKCVLSARSFLSVSLGIISNGIMARKKNALFYLLNPLKGSTITWWGRRRWQIEGWFKTAKHRFGLHRFGQGTLLGVYRWLVLSLIAYILAHWTYLSTQLPDLPDWGEAAQIAREFIFPQILVSLLLLNIEHLIPLARSYGFYIHVSRCKI